MARDTIYTAPKPPKSNPKPPAGGGGGGGKSSGGGSGGSGSGGNGGGGSDPYAYAKAQERKADREANRRYLDQAAVLQQQINAIRLALGKKGFKRELDIKLGNILRTQRIVDSDLMRGYRDRVGSLENTAEDNEKAASGQTVANMQNRSRERANALSEAMAQGAGESDVLRAQQMSLRNWQANQAEVNRSFFDTLTSVNSSLTDLTTDTRTARVNNVIEANADREQLYTNYYDQRAETLTQLGNTLGQQAEYYGLANEAIASKGTRGKQKGAGKRSGAAFKGASLEAGKAWRNPGVKKGLRTWEGAADFEGALNNSQFSSASTEIAPPAPEGATLRKWEQ